MPSSIERVAAAAAEAGLEVEILRMDGSTRTAQEAAAQCACVVEQIVKSLVFQGATSGTLYLFLVSGGHQLDLAKASALAGEPLTRADPRLVRDETGFAIGGVAPIGHRTSLKTYADRTLLEHPLVWAAAGAPDAVFCARPDALLAAAKADIVTLV